MSRYELFIVVVVVQCTIFLVVLYTTTILQTKRRDETTGQGAMLGLETCTRGLWMRNICLSSIYDVFIGHEKGS